MSQDKKSNFWKFLIVISFFALAIYYSTNNQNPKIQAQTVVNTVTSMPEPSIEVKKIQSGYWLYPCYQPGGCKCHSGLYPVDHGEYPDPSTERKPVWVTQ